jgi:glyceraldehyde 3-phosphate dehydrogenase
MKGKRMNQVISNTCMQDWSDRESTVENMIPMIGALYRKKNIVTSVYGRPIINRSVIDLLKAHRFVRHMEDQELSVLETFPIINAMMSMDLDRAHVDVGKLAVKFRNQENATDLETFLNEELKGALGQNSPATKENRDVVLYGFGRIGRLLARLIIERAGGGNGLR